MYRPDDETGGFRTLANSTMALWNALHNGPTASVRFTKRDEPTDTSQDRLTLITSIDIAGRYPFTEYEQWKAAAERLESTAPYGAENYATSNG
jgi:hypothetical protein